MALHVFAVCAYRESPYLAECFQSLCAQTEKSDIIVCTSTPNRFIKELCEDYGLPLFVREGESSLLSDWNFAVETAVRERGAKLVTVAHQDDRYHPDYTGALLEAAERWPDMSLFCTRYRTIDALGEETEGSAERIKRILRLPLRLRIFADRRFIKRLCLRFGNSIGCPTCTYVPEKTGLPLFRNNYDFVIDWDTLWRLSGEQGRFVCEERELMDYRVHAGAATMKNIENHNREREELMMFSRMWPLPVARVLMWFYRQASRPYENA
ncbi:MAG: glycosyltransferase [Eubacteriales bacterium]|nr:glycosyltransferase [Eubacteriales bacterium]